MAIVGRKSSFASKIAKSPYLPFVDVWRRMIYRFATNAVLNRPRSILHSAMFRNLLRILAMTIFTLLAGSLTDAISLRSTFFLGVAI